MTGAVGARDATLAIMVGGSKASYARSVQFLQPMARKVTIAAIWEPLWQRRYQTSQ